MKDTATQILYTTDERGDCHAERPGNPHHLTHHHDETWYAADAIGSPFVSHLLTERRWRGGRYARCGELRRKWKPVESFVYPEKFTRCGDCEATAAPVGNVTLDDHDRPMGLHLDEHAFHVQAEAFFRVPHDVSGVPAAVIAWRAKAGVS